MQRFLFDCQFPVRQKPIPVLERLLYDQGYDPGRQCTFDKPQVQDAEHPGLSTILGMEMRRLVILVVHRE